MAIKLHINEGIFDKPARPNWYGIDGIKFIYHNEWADPEIEYDNKLFNSHDVEDACWEDYNEDCKEDGTEPTEEGFAKWMKEHDYIVFDYIDNLIESGNYKDLSDDIDEGCHGKSKKKKKSYKESAFIEDTNKWNTEYVIQGNYGNGWDDLVTYTNKSEADADLRIYNKEESQYRHRLITRKVQNPNWDGTSNRKRTSEGVGIVVEDRINKTNTLYWTSDKNNYSEYSNQYLWLSHEYSPTDNAVEELDNYFENVEENVPTILRMKKRYGSTIYDLPNGNYVEVWNTLIIK